MEELSNSERLSLILGALLHDTGKIGQRAHKGMEGLSEQSRRMEQSICPRDASGNPTHLHVLYTNEFFTRAIEPNPPPPNSFHLADAANAAVYHHRPDTPLQMIVRDADRLSSGMERGDKAEDAFSPSRFRNIRLMSILHQIDLGLGRASCESALLRLEHLSEDLERAFPLQDGDSPSSGTRKADSIEEYAGLWNGLIDAWRNNEVADPLGYLNRGLADLETFAWCVPSATNVSVPDISLFDHSKTTAAIASCLYDMRKAEGGRSCASIQPFLLVEGEFGGIQSFIFDLRMGAGGLSKRLRGRSFFVALFTQMTACHLLRQCTLSHANMLMSAGGHFLLLLPNLPAIHAVLDDVQASIDRWSVEQASGEVRLNLGRAPCSEDDIRHFPRALEKVRAARAEAKARPLASWLLSGSAWCPQHQTPPFNPEDYAEGLCRVCLKEPGRAIYDSEHNRENVIGGLCEQFEKDGARLTRSAEVFVGAAANSKGITLPVGGYSIGTPSSSLVPAESHEVFALENAAMRTEGDDGCLPRTRWLFARHIPRNCENSERRAEGEVLDFDAIAKYSQGNDLLAYLKADVDNLGFVFKSGLEKQPKQNPPGPDEQGEEQTSRMSISRMATLSRNLNLFFAGWLQQTVERQFPLVYIVYSGGDDVLCLGPWNVMFDFAAHLRKKFSDFCAHNPNLTLSAGLALARPHQPVLQAVQWANEALDCAKNGEFMASPPPQNPPTNAPAPSNGRKDRVHAFGQTFRWPEFQIALDEGKRLAQWVKEEVIRSSQVRRLFRYARLHQAYLDEKNTRHLRYIPMLIWDLKRNWHPSDHDPLRAEKQAAHDWAYQLALPESQAALAMPFACQYAIHLTRNRNDNNEEEPGQ